MSDNEKKTINPVIFMDKEEKINPVIFLEKPEPIKKDPEEKKYLLFYYATEDGQDAKSFEELTGRTEVYNFIKNMIESLDIYQSKVLVESLPLQEAISVFEFMSHVAKFFENSFDIEDFNYLGLTVEQLEKERNDKNGVQ